MNIGSISSPEYLKLYKFLAITFIFRLRTCSGDIGTAAQYNSPYIPTTCYSDDTTKFPANNLFAAAGDGIWDNGAACGRQYTVQCISAPDPLKCTDPGSTIQVTVVDYADSAVSRPDDTTMFLSNIAFEALVNGSDSITAPSPSINIVFLQVD